MGSAVEGAEASCMMSCLSWEEDQGLQEWEEGQSHQGSLGGKVHSLGGGGAGKESLSKGLAELWVRLELLVGLSSLQP